MLNPSIFFPSLFIAIGSLFAFEFNINIGTSIFILGIVGIIVSCLADSKEEVIETKDPCSSFTSLMENKS